MSVTPRGASFLARVSFRGTRYAASFPSREAAQAWHDLALAALQAGRKPPSADGEEAPPDVVGTTLEAALALTLRTRWKDAKAGAVEKAISRARLVLNDLGASTPIESLTTQRLSQWQTELSSRGNSGATINRKMATIGALMRAVEVDTNHRYTAPKFPPRGKENSDGRQTVLTVAETRAAVAILRRQGDHLAADIVVLLFWTGMRLGEWIAQRWSDIHLDGTAQPWLKVRAEDAKNGESRKVYLTADAVEVLRRLIEEPHEDRKGRPPAAEPRVLPTFHHSTILGQFQRAARKAGVIGDDLCLHSLRHSCGTRMVDQGMSELVGMKILGHKGITMFKRYAKVRDARLAEAAVLLQGDD